MSGILTALLPLIGLVAIILTLGLLLRGKDFLRALSGENPQSSSRLDGPPPYRLKPHLISEPEANLAHLLEQIAAHREERLHVQVPLSALLEIPPGTDNPQAWRNKIDRKSLDFVLADTAYTPIVAIEYDDSSHQQRKRRERDAFVEDALESAGLPLVRIGYHERLDLQSLDARLGEAARSGGHS
ncbi:MAG: DUF2726 domain-containing protein [Planctomycetota bacterium]